MLKKRKFKKKYETKIFYSKNKKKLKKENKKIPNNFRFQSRLFTK